MDEVKTGDRWAGGASRWIAIGTGTAATAAGSGVLVRGMRSAFDLGRQPAVLLTAGLVVFVMWLWLPARLAGNPPEPLGRRIGSGAVATAVALAALWVLRFAWS